MLSLLNKVMLGNFYKQLTSACFQTFLLSQWFSTLFCPVPPFHCIPECYFSSSSRIIRLGKVVVCTEISFLTLHRDKFSNSLNLSVLSNSWPPLPHAHMYHQSRNPKIVKNSCSKGEKDIIINIPTPPPKKKVMTELLFFSFIQFCSFLYIHSPQGMMIVSSKKDFFLVLCVCVWEGLLLMFCAIST